MSNFLRSIDRIGKEFKFQLDGEESFTTSFGGIITILNYLGLITLFIYFGKELVIKQDPNFINRTDKLDYYPEATIDNSNFLMVIGFSYNDFSQRIYNLSYFDIGM